MIKISPYVWRGLYKGIRISVSRVSEKLWRVGSRDYPEIVLLVGAKFVDTPEDVAERYVKGLIIKNATICT